MLRIENQYPTLPEIKSTIGKLLDSLVADGHANHDLHPNANCQTCKDMVQAYDLLRRL